jgi:hypothetical protein
MTTMDSQRAVSVPVGLCGHFDNVGIAAPRWPTTGGFNIWSNTFPSDELPPVGATVSIGGVPFRFPTRGAGDADNVRCRGQRVVVPYGVFDWIYLLAAAERRTEDLVLLHTQGGVTRRQWLRVSDFWPETAPRFGELLAFRCSRMLYPRHAQRNMAPAIWRCRVPVPVPDPLVALTLPDNPAIHVFALTLVAEGRS